MPKKNFLLYCVVGAFAALGFQPFGAAAAFLAAFGWLFTKISSKLPLKEVMMGSFLFFFCFHVTSLYWIAYPLTIDIKRHGFLIPFAIALIPTCLGILLLPSVFIAKKYFTGLYAKAFAFSSLFCASIHVYGHFSLGFPWVLPGYVWSFHEMFLQTLSLFGIYGLSLMTMVMACFCGAAYAFHKKNDQKNAFIALSVVGAMLIFMIIFGWIRLSYGKTEFTGLRARIVQCNILQHEKNNPYLSRRNLEMHLAQSYHDGKIDLILWPEASIPFLYSNDNRELHSRLKSPLKDGEILIAGAVRKDGLFGKIHNSIVVIDHLGKNMAVYDKVRLVPFGEFVPLRKYLPFQSIAADIGDFDVGSGSNVFSIKGLNIAMTVCYEAVFPLECVNSSEIEKVDVMVNLTNDAWFGFTSEPLQHLHIVRARSIEIGIPLIRATNFGVSAAFDAHGRFLDRVPFNQSGYMDVSIPKKLSEATIYVKFGDLLFWIMEMAAFVAAFI